MGEKEEKREQEPPNLVTEIREGRKFTLAEAIGRLAGPGAMKGVSPATRKQQAEAVIERFLEHHLASPAGALNSVLFRQVRESELLMSNMDEPLLVLASHVQRVLDSDYLLQDLVRQSDCEWGRVYGERPYFEKPGTSPREEDPYTIASVRATLEQLIDRLSESASTLS